MGPKNIILKTQSYELFNMLIFKFNEIKNIRFFYRKINGFYTVVVKCHNYYNSKSILDETKLYGSYIFLYSIVSIILSELLITYYEDSVSKRIIYSKKKDNTDLKKLSSISSLLLDEYSPFEFSKLLYKKRKNYLVDSLLKNFRKRNFIFTDYFIDFFAQNYINELEDVINASLEILNNKPLYDYMMNFIFAHGDVH